MIRRSSVGPLISAIVLLVLVQLRSLSTLTRTQHGQQSIETTQGGPPTSILPPRHFVWKCSDQCSCLPPVPTTVTVNTSELRSHSNYSAATTSTKTTSPFYMHQSYKTNDPQHWPGHGWSVYRQTWIDLHPHWNFVFWLDQHNDLLARCLGFEELFRGKSAIARADLARLLYLYQYGGLYADMDYLALQSHHDLLMEQDPFRNDQILLQNRDHQAVSVEWAFAREPGHDFWVFVLERCVRKGPVSHPVQATGPDMLQRCLQGYRTLPVAEEDKSDQRNQHTTVNSNKLQAMVFYRHGIRLVPFQLVAPISASDFTSDCGEWRTNRRNHLDQWTHHWQNSTCRRSLVEQGSIAVTVYTQSWGMQQQQSQRQSNLTRLSQNDAAQQAAKRREMANRKWRTLP